MAPNLVLQLQCPVFSLKKLSVDIIKSSDALRAWANGEGEELQVRPIIALSVTCSNQ